MLTDAIASLFRNYTDESDTTFLSDANVVTYLNIGYEQFRQYVLEQDNHYYMIRRFIDVPGAPASSCDLTNAGTGPLLGANAVSGVRLYRLVRCALAEPGVGITDRDVRYYLEPARSLLEIQNGLNRYMLEGTILRFTGQFERIALEYIPDVSDIFTIVNTTGAGAFIDDLAGFHDIIALLAYQQYAITDFANNPVLVQQLLQRQKQLGDYLQTGRSWGARNRVISTDELEYLGW